MDWLHLLLIIAMVFIFARLNAERRWHKRDRKFLEGFIEKKNATIVDLDAMLRNAYAEIRRLKS